MLTRAATVAAGNCRPSIQEKLRVKRDDVTAKRAALAGVVGEAKLQAAVAAAKGDTAEPSAAPAAPSRTAELRPEPEPEPPASTGGSESPDVPSTPVGSPFTWKAPPTGGGGGSPAASSAYGGLSPIALSKSHVATDALAKMEQTLAESSRALASVREHSMRTMAEVDSRSRR